MDRVDVKYDRKGSDGHQVDPRDSDERQDMPAKKTLDVKWIQEDEGGHQVHLQRRGRTSTPRDDNGERRTDPQQNANIKWARGEHQVGPQRTSRAVTMVANVEYDISRTRKTEADVKSIRKDRCGRQVHPERQRWTSSPSGKTVTGIKHGLKDNGEHQVYPGNQYRFCSGFRSRRTTMVVDISRSPGVE